MPRREFQDLNEDGSRTYGWLWPMVNEAAVSAASRQGMVPWSPQEKAKIMGIVLAVMDSLNKKGVVKIPARDAKDFIMHTPTLEPNAKKAQ